MRPAFQRSLAAPCSSGESSARERPPAPSPGAADARAGRATPEGAPSVPVAHRSDRKIVPRKTTSISPQVGSGIIGAPPCQALVNGTGLHDLTLSPSIFVGGGYTACLRARLHHEW